MNYNFVIFATTFDWYKVMYAEVLERPDVRFYQDIKEFFSPMEQALYKIYMSQKVNRVISLPNKDRWFRKVVNQIQFENQNPVCFIWYSHFVKEIKRGMLDYIKKELPDSKHVMYYTDAKNVNQKELLWLSDKMDRIGVFDPTVAEKFGLEFWPNVYPGKKGEPVKEEYDLCFIGNDKGRLRLLEQIADECKKQNVNAAFYVKSNRAEKRCDNIHYIDEYLPYPLVVDIVKRSKTLLELRTEPYDTWSVRAQEAIVFNKKILTDNPNTDAMPCKVNTGAISVFRSVETIDWDFVKKEMDVDYQYHDEFSASAFLAKIEELVQ